MLNLVVRELTSRLQRAKTLKGNNCGLFLDPYETHKCNMGHNQNSLLVKLGKKRLRWSRGSVLAFGTQVRGFKPGRSRRKNPQRAFLRRGSKAVGLMS